MPALTTTERLYERYNSYTRRPVVSDRNKRKRIFGSLQRVLGEVLPSELDAPILDAACGEGALLSFLKEAGYRNLHGFDLSPENVTLCHGLGLHFVDRFDALEVERFKPGFQFETIFALDFLEHVARQKAATLLDFFRRRLRPGGSLIIQTPNLGCLFGGFHRYNDLSHEFGLTEKSAIDLLLVAGFEAGCITVSPAWNATTMLGRLREVYLRHLHRLVYLAEDRSRPQIPTKNLLIRAVNS